MMVQKLDGYSHICTQKYLINVALIWLDNKIIFAILLNLCLETVFLDDLVLFSQKKSANLV